MNKAYSEYSDQEIIRKILAGETREYRALVEKYKQFYSNLEGVSPAELLDSPKFLLGTEDEIVEMLQARRERFGISYYTIRGEGEHYLEMCKPILARLAGK